MRTNVAQIDRSGNESIETRPEYEPSKATQRVFEKKIFFSLTIRRTRKNKEDHQQVWQLGWPKKKAVGPQDVGIMDEVPSPAPPGGGSEMETKIIMEMGASSITPQDWPPVVVGPGGG